MSNELFIFFYGNILSENISLSDRTFAKTIRRESVEHLEVYYFCADKLSACASGLRNVCMVKAKHIHRQMQSGMCVAYLYTVLLTVSRITEYM